MRSIAIPRGHVPAFDHRDTNTLRRIEAPAPNQLVKLLKEGRRERARQRQTRRRPRPSSPRVPKIARNEHSTRFYSMEAGHMKQSDFGKNNQIETPSDTSSNLAVEVHGNENRILTGADCRFHNFQIVIKADNCKFDIGDRCVLIGRMVLRTDGSRVTRSGGAC